VKGQATVETALALGVALVLIGGIMAGALLLFQYEAVTNGARAGVRAAIVETSLLRSGPDGLCESGSPESVVQAVAAGLPTVAVDTAPLCQSGSDPNELVQAPGSPDQATITVTGSPDLSSAAGNVITVTVALPVSVPPPFPQALLTLRASAALATQ
jgi:Flp pilus assembly protein TadG